jgi:hypothetical protein
LPRAVEVSIANTTNTFISCRTPAVITVVSAVIVILTAVNVIFYAFIIGVIHSALIFILVVFRIAMICDKTIDIKRADANQTAFTARTVVYFA